MSKWRPNGLSAGAVLKSLIPPKGIKIYTESDVVEAAFDAMLEALRKQGQHFYWDKDGVCTIKVLGIYDKFKGNFVFIPDDEDEE